MSKTDLGLSNMNAVTNDDDTTCAITDMNCLDPEDNKILDIDNMNAVTNDDDTTCALVDMNCLDEK